MTQFFKILLAIVALLGIAAAYVLNPALPKPAGPQGDILYQPGELGLTGEALALTDNTRATMANGEFAGQPFRELNGQLWTPRDRGQGPYPLILYSHGFMSSVSEAGYLVDFLVPKGYVIAAVDYPLSSGGAPGGPTVNDVLNQPGDVSFVLDHLLTRNSTEGDALFGLIDPQRIAAAGLSLGGLTTQLAAFHRDVRDPRITAAVSIAGPAVFLTPEFFSTSDMPFMMIAGSADAIIPYQAHAAPIPQKSPQSLLVTLEGGTHIGFTSIASTFMRWFNHPDKLVCPMLLRGLENGDAPPEEMLPADAAIGISTDAAAPCTMTEFERAMRPGEQQMLTRLAMLSFLESVFAAEPVRRAQMRRYLTNTLAQEQSSVSLLP
jgi:pimeloyl-ACP methyl ester carboxylesterase